jgi:ADP-heptose:LPS heptosyltransferase
MLAALGARVVLEVPPGLGRLMVSIGGVTHVVEQGTRLPAHDYAIPVMSLPFFLGITLENLPARVPYLTPPEEVQARWDAMLASALVERPRIGIAWSGNPKFTGYATRSIPFATFERIRAARPEAKFVVLQTQYDEATAAAIEAADNLVIARTAISDFADTAALMRRLDLIISGDTSLVHLAGALGCPTWVLLQRAADWRWLRERSDSPWYPSLRLFRQPRHGDWETPVAEVSAALRQHRFEI